MNDGFPAPSSRGQALRGATGTGMGPRIREDNGWGLEGLEVGFELGVAGEFSNFSYEVADGGEGFAELDEFFVDGADG